MCGIAGVISLGGDGDLGDRDFDEVQRMTGLLRHRGPDGWGLHRGSRFILGNTRLRITDLSDDGAMPMASADASTWLTYNGEVTNFRELRRDHRLDELAAFRSETDTEVLLHLYAKMGIDFLDALTGQFGFCLVDRRAQKAWVVRDPFGMRPVFYMQTADRLYFASEIKSFLHLDAFDGELDLEALYHYLSLAYIPGAHTPFAAVRELDGGHLLEIDLASGTVTDRAWYEIRYEPNFDLNEDAAATRLAQEMRASVERNLISDTPVGLTFSGGVDSSSILALVKDLGKASEFHTFSIEMDEPSYNEARFQDIGVRFAEPIHHRILVGPDDILSHMVEHVAFVDEPCGDGALVPLYLLAKQASEYVPVLLTGEGGDEVFNAYETHVACRARSLYRNVAPKPLRALIRGTAGALPTNYRKLSFDFVAKRFTRGAELDVARAHYYWRHVLLDEEKRALMPDFEPQRQTIDLFPAAFDALDFDDDLDRISWIDLKYYFIGDLTVQTDRMAMAHSIEARFPWADRTLFEFIRTIPAGLRMKGLRRRSLQKKAMKPYLPPATHKRTNMGLEMPHSLWFLDRMRPMVETWLAPERIARVGFLDAGAVAELWRRHVAGEVDYGRALWCIVHLLIWHELFVQSRDFEKFLTPFATLPVVTRSDLPS